MPTVSTTAKILIDKHELHSTWPIYQQPDSKSATNNGVELVLERTQTCYGPGDRVGIVAILKSDSLSLNVLRMLEFALRETVVFRAGPQANNKKSGPLVRTGNIGEQRMTPNINLYAGQQFRTELGCVIPATHSTATVNAARHIDVSYNIHLKAHLDNGRELALDVPVTISNWPRFVAR